MQRHLLLLLMGVILLAGCSGLRFPGVYRIDIEQGNIVDAATIERLRPGLDPAQVRYVMGTPQLTDPFTPDRWVYYYQLNRGNGERVDARVVLFFGDGKLVRWEGEPLPAEARRRINTALPEPATQPDSALPTGAGT